MQKTPAVNLTMGAIGWALVAFCGGTLGRIMGISVGYSWVLPGFALGLFLISQASISALKARIERLEQQSRKPEPPLHT